MTHIETKKPSMVHSTMQALFQQRMDRRPKDAMEELGLPPSHAPVAKTYQDFLPPPSHPDFPLPIEQVDRSALLESASKGHVMARRALVQLEQQSQQHVLSENERSALAQVFVQALGDYAANQEA